MKGMALLLHVCLAAHQAYLTIALSEDTTQKRAGSKRSHIAGEEANERKRFAVLPPPPLPPQTTR